MIKLEYFTESDFNQLIDWVNTSLEFFHQWGGHSFTYPLTISQLEEYIERANTEGARAFIYKVIDTSRNKIIGHISIGRIDYHNDSARIGRVLIGDKAYLGKGIGTLMMKQCTDIAFRTLPIHRLSLGVFDFNKAAIRSYEKVGFIKEGTLRDHAKYGGEYWSLIEMSMLREEWSGKQNEREFYK